MKDKDKRLLLLIKALIYGYRYTTSNGMLIGMDEDYKPYIICNDGDYILPCMFEFDLSWLSKEAELMPDTKEFEICSFLSLNKDRIEKQDKEGEIKNE